MKNRVSKISHKGKEIIYVDYSGLQIDDEMIALLNISKEMIGNKKFSMLADYTNAYAPAKYLKAANDYTNETKSLGGKTAFIGITGAKEIILKGMIRITGANYKIFNSKQTALDYLAE